ncbi:hypothetical protein [Oerskovia flava]|uniref:hypothetical protein n=1 Tax=Oerskovia flava TaxID=2986422 RepID=UPI00223F879C|nr:hypothetical protein [Oerskovia sp. JB1-3-2]
MLTARRAPALAAGALLLVITACATGTEPGGASPTSQPEESGTVPEDETTQEETVDPDGEGRPDAADMTLEPGASGRGLPAGIDAPTDGGSGAAWTDQDGLLYVFTHGSSSCPVLAEGAAEVADGDVVVTFIEIPADQVCTMDYVPATTVVSVPDGVDASAPVTVVLDRDGSVSVPARTDGAPGEAAWVGLA